MFPFSKAQSFAILCSEFFPALTGPSLRAGNLSSKRLRLFHTMSEGFGNNAFSGLSGDGLPPGRATTKRKDRGRVDIIRQTAGRGGKTVTVVANFIGIGLPEKERLAKEMQKTCGTGGTVKEGRIEIQGDKREEIARILTAAGFRPVFAGG